MAADHEEEFNRILDILAALAEAQRQDRQRWQEWEARVGQEFERMRQNLDRSDEQIGALIRMMDEWIRRRSGP